MASKLQFMSIVFFFFVSQNATSALLSMYRVYGWFLDKIYHYFEPCLI